VTLYEVHGRGRSIQRPEVLRDTASKRHIDPDFGERLKLKVLVDSSLVKPIVDEMSKLPSKGTADYTKVFVYDVSEAYDTGTKKRGDEAI
jgi:nitrogen regulatory protein PII